MTKQEIKAQEKRDSQIGIWVLLGYIVVALVFAIILVASSAKAADYELTYYAKSEHFSAIPFNEEHNYLGLELRDDNNGIGLARFRNSYRKMSTMLSYSEYWQDNQYPIEYSLSIGAATNYEEVTDVKYSPVLSAGISYTEYQYIRPKLSVFNDALVFSLSARF